MNHKRKLQRNEYDKDDIKRFPREFRFGIDCILALMRGPDVPWDPKADPYRHVKPDPEKSLCTQSIVNAVQYMVAEEVAAAIDTTIASWILVEGPGYQRYSMLMNMLVTEFCDQPYTVRRFLEICCTMAEISIVMHNASRGEEPLDYCALCIFYCVLHSMETHGRGENYKMFQDLDEFACHICTSHQSRDFDPVIQLLRNRRTMLSYINIDY